MSKSTHAGIAIFIAAITPLMLFGQKTPDDAFSILSPFVGKTWVGVFEAPEGEEPGRDVSRWEWALNRKAVRILHSLNEGQYGGETLVVWDVAEEQLVYHYFTTAGFMTKGTMRSEDGRLVSHEYVTGNSGGITEVKATSEMLPGGSFRGSSQYLKDGVWVEGHSAVYREDNSAQLLLNDPLADGPVTSG